MKSCSSSKLLRALGVGALIAAVASVAHADNVVSIFGSGNPNTGWTTSSNSNLNLQLALRAKNRDTGATNDVGAIYYMPTGPSFSSATKAVWNFEFSINTNPNGLTNGTHPLTSFTYKLFIDTDPSAAVSPSMPFDPLVFYPDYARGYNNTANGAGVTTGVANLFDVAQNSENMAFFPWSSLNFGDGTYDFRLEAYDGQATVGSVSMTVVVGNGGSSVPDSASTLGLLAGAVATLGFFAKRKSRSV